LTTEHAQEIIKAREKRRQRSGPKSYLELKARRQIRRLESSKLKVLLPVGVSVDGKQSFRGSSLMI
jgi:hypothetical protein